MDQTVGRSGMYIVKAETNQVEKIVDISIRAFETDVNVGGLKGECPPEFDSVEWHKQMAREGHLYQAMIGQYRTKNKKELFCNRKVIYL